MIHLMDHPDAAAPPLHGGKFIPWDIFSARVWAARRSYDDGQFWVQNHPALRAPLHGGECTAAISLVDGFAMLAAKESAGWEELLAFLQMQPWVRLQCTDQTAAKLPFPAEWTSVLMRFGAPKRVPLDPDPCPLTLAADVGEVYDMLVRCGFEGMRERLPWMADMALRWRRGTAQSWIAGGLSTASATALSQGYCFIGAVGTVPEARGRGLAGQLVARIAIQQRALGREIWLSCREERAGFYESVGFVRAGEMVTMRKEGTT